MLLATESSLFHALVVKVDVTILIVEEILLNLAGTGPATECKLYTCIQFHC